MDGDAQLLYYRNDILTDPKWQDAFKKETGKDMVVPPQTWQQLYEITNFFNGKDWNGDGDPDDGITLHLQAGGQGHFHYATLAASFAVTPDSAKKQLQSNIGAAKEIKFPNIGDVTDSRSTRYFKERNEEFDDFPNEMSEINMENLTGLPIYENEQHLDFIKNTTEQETNHHIGEF